MHVCLVRPPTVTDAGIKGQNAVPPIGLAYIAGSLVDAGHRVTVVDAVGSAPTSYRRVEGFRNLVSHGLSSEEVAAMVPADADLIGISCMFSVEWLPNRHTIQAIHTAPPSRRLRTRRR